MREHGTRTTKEQYVSDFLAGRDGASPGKIDVDGDGVPDIELVDVDGDGVVDAQLEDYDGDGVPETELYDTDGDGRPDVVVERVGGIETISADLDGDGRLEVQDSFPVE
jgi:hypothetical protein